MSRPARRGGHTHWSPAEMDRLERAIVEGARVQLSRRGTVYMVVPREIRPRGPSEFLIGTTNAGDDLAFALDEIEHFDVIW
ncbi:MAG: hypothetical protein KY464_04155 [Gemmatimonadetes bacterium]|nr:hypothetical protein [Gemmatimonadota bacterium]